MYTVIEIQTGGGTMAVLHTELSDLNTAYQKFHTILAAAAVSKVEVHAAVILNEAGNVVASAHFVHPAAIESEE